ncbi:MAG: antibiotic biosynthesis monooxygenase [Hyphomonadaceae bacterium]|nr:antibiotic biosynthesis monooxygenase [Hyphomonadaceae bacterium]
MSYVILWSYEVAPEHERAFIAAYGPEGDWARLFATAAGFLGVDLYRDGARFLTIDRWQSEAAFQAFQAARGAEYQALDARCDALTLAETRLGAFVTA